MPGYPPVPGGGARVSVPGRERSAALRATTCARLSMQRRRGGGFSARTQRGTPTVNVARLGAADTAGAERPHGGLAEDTPESAFPCAPPAPRGCGLRWTRALPLLVGISATSAPRRGAACHRPPSCL